tara:strand:- start:34 stop:420 length:387 start_codon:yes stop_codon:yes gene_type:complete
MALTLFIFTIIILQFYRQKQRIKSTHAKKQIESELEPSLIQDDKNFRNKNKNLSKIGTIIVFFYLVGVINVLSLIIFIGEWGFYSIALIIFAIQMLVCFVFIRAFRGIKDYLYFLSKEIHKIRYLNNE